MQESQQVKLLPVPGDRRSCKACAKHGREEEQVFVAGKRELVSGTQKPGRWFCDGCRSRAGFKGGKARGANRKRRQRTFGEH